MLVHGSNLVVSAPNASRVIDRLSSLDLLVVCDFVPSETALLADVVLPVTQWAEEEGTMTSLEGRVIRRRAAVAPPGEARSELWILAELARRLGAPESLAFPTDPAVVFDELARASAGGPADYSGLSHARLDADEASGGPGLFWPVPAVPAGRSDPAGNVRPRRRVGAPRYAAAVPRPVRDTGRAGAHGRRRPRGAERRGAARRPVLPGHGPGAAALPVGRADAPRRGAGAPRVRARTSSCTRCSGYRIGVPDGARVRLTSSRGRVEATARWTDAVRPDTVFMPFHWSGIGSVNQVTTDATDPISGMPEFKVCAVDVSVVPLEAESDSVEAEPVSARVGPVETHPRPVQKELST